MSRLRKLTVGLVSLLMCFAIISGVKAFAGELPASIAQPKDCTIEYDKSSSDPSAICVKLPGDSKLREIDDISAVTVTAQVDWRFTKNDDWKYSESWDLLKKATENSYWELVDQGYSGYNDDFMTQAIFEFGDSKYEYYTEPGIGWGEVVPKSLFTDVAYCYGHDTEKVNMIDWNKVGVEVRYRYVALLETYNDEIGEYEGTSVASPWSNTTTFGDFAADYDDIDNLLVNPDFEEGLKGWKDPDKVWAAVVKSDVGDPKHGIALCWPLTGSDLSNTKTRIYQDVSLENYKADETVIFNALICNYDQAPHDMAKVNLTFLDKDGKSIESYSQSQRNPNWNSQSLICSIPEGAKTLRVSLYAYRYVGSDIDAYYDYCSLVVKPEKVNPVKVTAANNKSKVKMGDKVQLTADNGTSKNASDYTWSSSYNTGATVDANGLVTFHTDAEDGLAIYAKDKSSGVTGVYWFNSTEESNGTVVDASDLADVKVGKPSISKLTAGKKTLTATWKKVSGANGYEIRYSLKSNMKNAKTVTIKKASTIKKKLSKLTSGKKYYVQVRAYKTVAGSKVYSAWSAKKNVKVK